MIGPLRPPKREPLPVAHECGQIKCRKKNDWGLSGFLPFFQLAFVFVLLFCGVSGQVKQVTADRLG